MAWGASEANLCTFTPKNSHKKILSYTLMLHIKNLKSPTTTAIAHRWEAAVNLLQSRQHVLLRCCQHRPTNIWGWAFQILPTVFLAFSFIRKSQLCKDLLILPFFFLKSTALSRSQTTHCRVQGISKSTPLAKKTKKKTHFLFNLRFDDCWKGSNQPPRDFSHAALTDEGSHMFFLAVSAWRKPLRECC